MSDYDFSHVQFVKLRSKLLLFLVVPFVIWAILVSGYAIGPDWMRSIVSPNRNREFGALENLQNLLLLISIVLAFKASRRAASSSERMVWFLTTGVFCFLFLEEINYGQTYFRYFSGTSFKVYLWDQQFQSFHNLKLGGKQNFLLKNVFRPGGEYLVVGFFIVFPLLMYRCKNVLFRRIVPSLWFIPLAFLSILCNKIVHSNRGELEGGVLAREYFRIQ